MNENKLKCHYCGFEMPVLRECPECKSTNLDYLTRIIGYLKRVSNFSMPRQQEAARRYYGNVRKMKLGNEVEELAQQEAK